MRMKGRLGSYVKAFLGIIGRIVDYLFWILGVPFCGAVRLAFPVAVNQVIDKIMPKGDFRLIALASAGLFAFYIINTFYNLLWFILVIC